MYSLKFQVNLKFSWRSCSLGELTQMPTHWISNIPSRQYRWWWSYGTIWIILKINMKSFAGVLCGFGKCDSKIEVNNFGHSSSPFLPQFSFSPISPQHNPVLLPSGKFPLLFFPTNTSSSSFSESLGDLLRTVTVIENVFISNKV